MKQWFHDEHTPAKFQDCCDLTEKGLLVRDFMDHVEGESKIDSIRYADLALAALVQGNPGFKFGSPDLNDTTGAMENAL